MPTFYKLQGKIQPYQWGGSDFIPNLLGQAPKAGQPAAEYWLGTHPSAPSLAVDADGSDRDVAQLLAAHAQTQLDFLFKVLDVRDMLSIQVHPTRAQARLGFERENAAGIPLDAKHRNYKDASDKPELMVALCEFWLLHGFQSINNTRRALQSKDFLAPLLARLDGEGLAAAFRFALDHQHPQVQSMHTELARALRSNALEDKSQIDFWIHRWLNANPHTPNGILTLYFFNLVKLDTGMAVYQPPGLPHAYLEGQNIELMANSDNVLRAGLTPKHIDVDELMQICNFVATEPCDFIIQPAPGADGPRAFPAPFEDFELSEIVGGGSGDCCWHAKTPEILFCYRGKAQLKDDQGEAKEIAAGDAVLVLPNATLTLAPGEGLHLFRARNKRR